MCKPDKMLHMKYVRELISTCFKKATVRNFEVVTKCTKMATSEKVNVVCPKSGHKVGWKIMTFSRGAHANLRDNRDLKQFDVVVNKQISIQKESRPSEFSQLLISTTLN